MPKAMGLTAAIGLSALVLTGCGSKKDSSDAQPSASAPGASSSAGAGSPSKSSGKSTGKSGGTGKGQASGKGATVLPVTSSVRSALVDAYLMNAMKKHPKEKTSDVVGPSETHYGKAGGVYYAIGEISLKNDPATKQDGPFVWKSPNGTDWSYEGDTGGSPCGKVPAALVKAWGKSCG
ncbi:hypothetical protein [Actinoallomurus sp. CA-150999]|uniref:hypothetical protein n=1 Tax=Actinoallomurus sp. CA-150999 TaxID=3239887 RepID=UPI003D93D9BE